MKYLSLFSGIEAATVAWHPLGWKCAAVAEVEPFPCQVLAHHYPDVPNLGDVTKITEQDIKALGHIDVVVFGSPCQDLSVAGHRKGLINADGTITRSGLFFTAINIARWSGARFWLWENVPGAYSSNKGRDFAAVVEFMAGLDECPIPPRGWATEGVAVGDNGLLEWACLDAQWFGVAQRRRRVFALLDTGNWTSRPPILLEPEGLRGDSAPSRETGKDITEPITAGISKGCRGTEGVDSKWMTTWPAEVCPTINAHFGDKQGLEDQHINGGAGLFVPVTHSLRGEGFDASEDGTGRGTPIVPVTFGAQMSVPQTDFDMVQTLQAKNPTGGGRPLPAVAYGIRTANTSSNGWGIQENVTHTLDQAQPHAVSTSMQVRRLTPRECERLQGFPDDYTDIKPKGKPTADGPRYKALGNSMAVPVMAWIGKQIEWATL